MTHSDKCPICSSPSTIFAQTVDDGIHVIPVECIRCGKYSYTHDLDVKFPFERLQVADRAKISAGLYHQPQTILSSEILKQFLKHLSPSVGTRAELLLLELSRRHPEIGAYTGRITLGLNTIIGGIEADNITIDVFTNGQAEELLPLLPLSHSMNVSEIEFLLDEYLCNGVGYLNQDRKGKRYRITPEGWARIHALENESLNSKQGFVAMSFDKDLYHVYDEGIEPGFKETEFKPQIMRHLEHNNWIADEIMIQIRRSRFVIADVSRQNQGVYFEAGFAIGLGIPVIWICSEAEFKNRHFDTAQINTIKYTEDDLPSLSKALKNRIENTIILKNRS